MYIGKQQHSDSVYVSDYNSRKGQEVITKGRIDNIVISMSKIHT